MADNMRLPRNWGEWGAAAGVVVAAVLLIQWFVPIPIFNSPTDPPALTATIESFPYRHAETKFYQRKEEWREEWLQPFEGTLKERGISPELIEIAVAAMEDLINAKFELEAELYPIFSISRTQMWYSVTIRNDGDKPLKDVFLKFPAAEYWIDERGRLVFVSQRIEIGDMDQKSEESFTFWGGSHGSRAGNDGVVLGHSNGLGTIEFE